MTRPAALAACLALVGCSGWGSSAPQPADAGRAPSVDPCGSPEARQFDFLVGSWTMSWVEFGPTRFTGHDTFVRNGCELDEVLTAPVFEGTSDYRATSVLAIDPASGKWTQRYRDTGGGQRVYFGGLAGGRMVLVAGGGIRQRAIWRNVTASSLVWELDTSSDGVHWDQYLVVDYSRA
jgi:hypothetical protein